MSIGKYNGQSKSEYLKNFKRIKDIVKKETESEKQIRLPQKQAHLIKDEHKAINRAMAARDLKQEHLFDVFFRRAYELGSVDKQKYREYQLSKLGI